MYFPLKDMTDAKEFFKRSLMWEMVKKDEVIASFTHKILDFTEKEEEFEADLQSHLNTDMHLVFSARLTRKPNWWTETKKKSASRLTASLEKVFSSLRVGKIKPQSTHRQSIGPNSPLPLSLNNNRGSISILQPCFFNYDLAELLSEKRRNKTIEEIKVNKSKSKPIEKKLSDLKYFKDEDVVEKSKPLSDTITGNLNFKMYTCIEKDDFEEFSTLIKQRGVDFNWKHPIENKSNVFRAVELGRLRFLESLIECGFNINEQDLMQRTPLFIACHRGNREIAVYLLANGAKPNHRDGYGYHALLVAFKAHQFHLIPDLILFGADINLKRDNGMSVLHDALVNNDSLMFDEIMKIDAVRLNIKDQNQRTPLLRACEKTDLDLFFKIFTKNGVDISAFDENSRNMFHLLALYQRTDILEALSNGSPEETVKFKSLLDACDSKRRSTPLSLGVENNSYSCVFALKYLCVQCNLEVKWDVLYEIIFNLIDKEFLSIYKFNPRLEHMDVLDKVPPPLLKMETILASMRSNRNLPRRLSKEKYLIPVKAK
jgi:hypothetical protein